MRGVRAWPVALCALATVLAGSSAAAAPPPVADTVVRNAKIYTVDAQRRTVQAIAIKDGKIIYAGDEKGLKPFIGSRTAIKDAKGKLMLPGLIDAHIHPIGIVDFGGCNLQAKPYTLAQIATIVGGCVKDAKLKPGEWLGVSQWEYAAGNQTDDRFKTLRDALDAASSTNPIVMTGWDGHHGAYNSAALKLARNAQGATVGYSRETLEKDFAQFKALVGVDSHGEPSGDIQDEGKSPIDSSSVSRMNFEKLLAAPNRLSERLNSVGITAIQDAAASMGDGVFGKDSIYRIYDELLERGQMTFRVNMAQFWLPDAFKKPDGDIDWDALLAKADAVRRKYARSPLTTADVVKVFADGDMEANPNNTPPTFGASPRPVPYLQPIFEKDAQGFLSVKDYVDINAPVCVHVRSKPEDYGSPQEVANFIKRYGYHPGQCAISYGTTSFAPWVFAEYVKRAHLAGYTVHIHTISDAAVDMAITAIEEARKADGNSSRPDTLAHIQCATPAAVQRMGRDKLYGVFTYSWHYAEPHGYDMSTIPFFDKVHGNSYEALHNPDGYFERCTYPTKTAKTAGVILAAGSDAPVLTSDPQPFVNMEIGVTRARRGLQPLSPWQRLTIEDLVEAYTINGARNLRRDADIGSLEVGKSADFIIVDHDILQLGDSGHADKIGDTRVMETWFMGKPVYTASAAN